jgi:pimeloyl-ACP methyl ester carboxylesterase
VGVLVAVSVNGTSQGPLSSASLIQTDVGYTPKYVSIQCPSGTGGPGVTCGQLIVPQDRAHPKGLQVRLLVVRAQAQTSQPAADPVLDLGDYSEGASSTTRLYSNYIELSFRGDHSSTPALTCPEEQSAAEAALALPPLSPQGLNAQATAFAACRTRLLAAGIDPNDYGNDAASADVRDLLRVLHIKRANILATSYNSSLVYDVMRRYPQLVRSVSIEDPIPPGFSPDWAAVTNLRGALDRYFALCTADQRCHAAFPDLGGQALRGYSQLQQQPVTVNAPVPPNEALVPVLIDGDRATLALASALSNSATLSVIASSIYGNGQSNPQLIASAAVIWSFGYPNPGHQLAWGANASFTCKDDLPSVPSFRRLEEQSAALAYPQLSGIEMSSRLDPLWCQGWNVKPDDPNDFTPITSDIPTFFIRNSLDPLTAPGWIGQVTQGFAHSVVLTFSTLSAYSIQTSSAPACLTTLRLDFLRHPTAHFNVSGCEAQSPPISFAGT